MTTDRGTPAPDATPKYGERVRTTLEGVLECHPDGDAGYVNLRGWAKGHEHLPWVFTLHWATEFERVPSPDGDDPPCLCYRWDGPCDAPHDPEGERHQTGLATATVAALRAEFAEARQEADAANRALAAVRELPEQWMNDMDGYPDTEQWIYAKGVLIGCRRELLAALAASGPSPSPPLSAKSLTEADYGVESDEETRPWQP